MKLQSKIIINITFSIYMFILVGILIFKFPTGMVRTALLGLLEGKELTRAPMQLIPFKTIIEYARNVHSFTDWFIKNLACNIIMFMPLGFYIPFYKKNKKRTAVLKKELPPYISTIIAGFCLSLAIELIQYVTCLGLCDIDDIILNVAGAGIGYLLFALVCRIKQIRK